MEPKYIGLARLRLEAVGRLRLNWLRRRLPVLCECGDVTRSDGVGGKCRRCRYREGRVFESLLY